MSKRAAEGLAGIVRNRRAEWLGTAAVCFSLALAYSLGGKLRRVLRGEDVDWTAFSNLDFVHFALWALLYPAVVVMVVRFPLGERWGRRLPVHLLAAFVFSPVLMILTYLSRGLLTGQGDWSVRGLIQDAVVPELAWGLTAYLIMVSVAHAFEYRRSQRLAISTAEQLQAALLQSRLESLRLQLQPHFLFNTLNMIASLIRSDPAAAERVVARLGDLLRLTLDDGAPQTVPLERELELLEGYLAIERARFRDRLSVVLDIADDTLGAAVPYLVLQPLAENAVRHGVARRAGAGLITVRAQLRLGLLVLEVEDNGVGLEHPGESSGNGVGLSNTRARLEHLYGARGRLRLIDRPGGGTRARIVLPRCREETGA